MTAAEVDLPPNSTVPPECARPRAQQWPLAARAWNAQARRAGRRLPCPRTGALRSLRPASSRRKRIGRRRSGLPSSRPTEAHQGPDSQRRHLPGQLHLPAQRRGWPRNPGSFFLHLVAAQEPPYGAFVDTGEWVIGCASPELFFRLDGAHIVCRPMKGTAARGLTQAAGPGASRGASGPRKRSGRRT